MLVTFSTNSGVSYPAAGLGQVGVTADQGLSRITNLPTFDGCTLCGYFYYSGNVNAWQCIVSYLNASNYTYIGVNTANSDVSYIYTQNVGVVNGPTLVPGTWYFWAIIQNGGSADFYLVPKGTALTTPTWAAQSYVAGAAVRIYLLHYSGGNTTTQGYIARARGWSSLLSVSELNAERVSATAVKAGALFDAALDATNNLGGFTMDGTLTAGP